MRDYISHRPFNAMAVLLSVSEESEFREGPSEYFSARLETADLIMSQRASWAQRSRHERGLAIGHFFISAGERASAHTCGEAWLKIG